MRQFIESVRKAIKDQNWYAALFIALALPDICGSIETPETPSKERYTGWFNRYLGKKYPNDFFTAEDCYYFRCTCLHEGIGQDRKARTTYEGAIHFITPRKGAVIHLNKHGNALQMQIDIFCNDVCEAVEEWLRMVKEDESIRARLELLLNMHEHRDGKISWAPQPRGKQE